MTRKYIPFLIGLLMLTMPACLPDPSLLWTATPTATSAPSNTPSATSTSTPAPATNTPPPPTATDTPSPTDTPGPTDTPTAAPPYHLIADGCKLLDANLVETLVGQKMVNTQKSSQPAGLDFCTIGDAQRATGAKIAVGQGSRALNYLVKRTAELEIAKGCATPVDAPDDVIGVDAIRKASGEIGKFPLRGDALLKAAYNWGYAKIQEMGCSPQYGVQALTGQGDASFADHIFGDEEISVVSRNTLIYITVYQPGLAAADLIAAEMKVMQSVLSQLGP